MAPRGRHWVALWLVFLLAVLTWVVARQTSAVVASTELGDLRNQRSALEARKADLERRIRQSRSRSVLIPKAESLGLRLPADSEIIILQLPSPQSR